MSTMKKRAPRSLAFAITALTAAALAAALSAAPRPAAATAHKFHTSFTEASYNAETGVLEVSLRTFPDDLEAAVARRPRPAAAATKARRDRKKEFEERVAAYVAETFRLRTAGGESIKIRWVGMDAGVDSAFLYFEAALPGGLEGVVLGNTFLSDLYADQINLVNLRAGASKASLRFERGAGDFKTISLK